MCSDDHKHNKTLQLKIELAFEYAWIYIAIALIFNKHFTFPTIFSADRG